ncbi:MAG TPA: hypothetical protein VHV77_15390 [Pirellulales bacterium]|nr:hypothetical protein [Pirellulales bacterium]
MEDDNPATSEESTRPAQPAGQQPQASDGRLKRAGKKIAGWRPPWQTVLSALSLIVAITAATAAWQSSEAAKESAQIAREQEAQSREAINKSGVYMKIAPIIGLTGGCPEGQEIGLTAWVTVYNEGHIPGRLKKVILGVDVPPGLQNKLGDHPDGPALTPLASWKADLVLQPQDSEKLPLEFGCNELKEAGIDIAHAAEQIKTSIERKALSWILWPWWTYNNPTNLSPTIEVTEAHIWPHAPWRARPLICPDSATS